MAVTEDKLSEFAASFPAGKIPKDILHLGKRLLMNDIAVALYAAEDPALDILLGMFAEEGGAKRASVIGTGVKTTLLNAALANGFLGHFLDYDDTHLATVIHTASPIFPAAMAAAEANGATGKDMLVAGVLGIEVACRIGLLIVPHFTGTGPQWHITNTCGVFGAATASARLLKLKPEQIIHALSLAGTQAMGIREVFGSMAKPFHAGKAAQNGLLASMLSKRGFTGIGAESPGILSGPRAFASVMAKGYDVTSTTKGLGEVWQLPDVAIKPHACGQANHALIDCMGKLRTKPGVVAENIAHIEGRLKQLAPNIATRRHPVVGLEGKFSYQHTMTCMLRYGNAYPQVFTDETVNDPVNKALRDRIDVIVDESVPRHAAKVTIKLKNGEVLEETVLHSHGTPENPLTDAQLEEKFRALAGTVLPKKAVDDMVEALWTLDKAKSAAQVCALLGQPIKARMKKRARKPKETEAA